MPDKWLVGEAARLSITIANMAAQAVDPAALRLKLRAPDGSLQTLTYGAGAEIVCDALGSYRADVLLSTPGAWSWRWETDGPASAVEGTVSVARSRVIQG